MTTGLWVFTDGLGLILDPNVLLMLAIGVIAASFMGGEFEVALLSGYAGSDLLESLVKLKFKEKFDQKISSLGKTLK